MRFIDEKPCRNRLPASRSSCRQKSGSSSRNFVEISQSQISRQIFEMEELADFIAMANANLANRLSSMERMDAKSNLNRPRNVPDQVRPNL